MSGKPDTRYSQHASCRMQPHGIDPDLVGAALPLIKGICCLLPAERAAEVRALVARGQPRQKGELPVIGASGAALALLTELAIHIECYRLGRTSLPVYQGREQLMAGAAALLGEEACLEDQDAFRLLALLLDKLLRGGRGSRQAKLDGVTLSAMEVRAVAATSPDISAVMRGSWRRKSRHQLRPASWLDVVEAALWCFWHGDDVASGEVLLGVLLGKDERVRLVYGLLAGAFYLAELAE